MFGHYTAAIAECRRAIESLWKSANLTEDARAARKLLSTVSEQTSMTKRDRELALGEAIRIFTHVAHHVGADAEPEVFGRLDAAMAVAATAGLVSSLVTSPDTRNPRKIARKPIAHHRSNADLELLAPADKAIEHFRKQPANRPRTRKSLRSMLDSLFGKKLSTQQLDGLMEELKIRKAIVEVDGKLKYADTLK